MRSMKVRTPGAPLDRSRSRQSASGKRSSSVAFQAARSTVSGIRTL